MTGTEIVRRLSGVEDGIEFIAWPKTARLFRDMVVTEKLDGTNAAVGITPEGAIYAQSRKRIIVPGKQTDNFGFAEWVAENAGTLTDDLGPGLHFGEWWGRGIARGYGQEERFFSLFNTRKWSEDAEHFHTPNLAVVPHIWTGEFDTKRVASILRWFRDNGSEAAPGFMRPEGVCVYPPAAGIVLKALLENDDQPKGLVAA